MSVSPKLRKQINVELEQLNLLLKHYLELFEKCKNELPNFIEISALAGFLHSFYSGVENIFKRISIEVDKNFTKGEAWHTHLLGSMVRPQKNRLPVITEQMHNKLKDYLDFRHMFRHAYTFELKWNKMKSLVLNAEKVLRQLEDELKIFISAIESK